MGMKHMNWIKWVVLTIFCMGMVHVFGRKSCEDHSEDRQEGLFSETVAPEIPDEVVFCGQTIALDRYDLRERYDRELLAMIYLHSSTLQLIKRANRYFPVIEPILKKHGIPDDMKYLACIESGLNHKASSHAGAVGMWQFIPETARKYGLEVTSEVDERYNIIRSTEAACKYLNYAYSLYGDWATVAASYNAGYARISNELERQSATNALDLWLYEETLRYVFRIITCKDFMQDPKRYGYRIHASELYPPYQTRDTLVQESIQSWPDFAQRAGVSFADLKYFNTWIRTDALSNTQGKTYHVVLPEEAFRHYDKKNIPVHNKRWVVDAY